MHSYRTHNTVYDENDYLTMKDVGNEVVMANGKPKPTKYGQLHSMYDSRLCTSQPTQMLYTNAHSQIYKVSKQQPCYHREDHAMLL